MFCLKISNKNFYELAWDRIMSFGPFPFDCGEFLANLICFNENDVNFRKTNIYRNDLENYQIL